MTRILACQSLAEFSRDPAYREYLRFLLVAYEDLAADLCDDGFPQKQSIARSSRRSRRQYHGAKWQPAALARFVLHRVHGTGEPTRAAPEILDALQQSFEELQKTRWSTIDGLAPSSRRWLAVAGFCRRNVWLHPCGPPVNAAGPEGGERELQADRVARLIERRISRFDRHVTREVALTLRLLNPEAERATVAICAEELVARGKQRLKQILIEAVRDALKRAQSDLEHCIRSVVPPPLPDVYLCLALSANGEQLAAPLARKIRRKKEAMSEAFADALRLKALDLLRTDKLPQRLWEELNCVGHLETMAASELAGHVVLSYFELYGDPRRERIAELARAASVQDADELANDVLEHLEDHGGFVADTLVKHLMGQQR